MWKNMLTIQPKNPYTVVQSNGQEKTMIIVLVTIGYSLLSFS